MKSTKYIWAPTEKGIQLIKLWGKIGGLFLLI